MSEGYRLGVAGWPVAHSRSPQMQNAALRAVGLDDWRYQLLPIPPDMFSQTVRALPRMGFRGINVTIPHKEAALALATRATPAAQAIGAANTLIFEDDATVTAENTDGPALLEALPDGSPSGATVLILGAGGSARAAAWAFRKAGAEVRIWNRTPERAEALAAHFQARAVRDCQPADFLVNCTSVGLARQSGAQLKQLPVGADEIAMYECVIDLVYSASETELIRAARRANKPYVDGLDLLVRQGALSFELFTGRPAPVKTMRAAAGAG